MPDRGHVFGPVPSRRLGRSLGVDLVPLKTCTFDCIYCQLGRTTELTVTRAEYVATGEVIREIEEALGRGARPDYVTFSGSGEPTLHSGLGRIIDAVREMTDTRVAILTNGSLFSDPEVRDQCGRADLVIPSLDVADPRMFRCVNRPHRSISFLKMVKGLAEFRKTFQGQLWLEILLLYGVTGVGPYVRRMLPLIEKINPDRVQINTAVRPPAETSARPVPKEDLEELAAIIGPRADVIAEPGTPEMQGEFRVALDDILAVLSRRPSSVEDLASGLGIHRMEAMKYLEALERDGRAQSLTRDGITYYFTR